RADVARAEGLIAHAGNVAQRPTVGRIATLDAVELSSRAVVEPVHGVGSAAGDGVLAIPGRARLLVGNGAAESLLDDGWLGHGARLGRRRGGLRRRSGSSTALRLVSG